MNDDMHPVLQSTPFDVGGGVFIVSQLSKFYLELVLLNS
jgi:hypothetical protein